MDQIFGNPVTVQFESETGRLYAVQACEDVAGPLWTNVATNVIGLGAPLVIEVAPGTTQRIYRVGVGLAP